MAQAVIRMPRECMHADRLYGRCLEHFLAWSLYKMRDLASVYAACSPCRPSHSHIT